jgi:voltage-gated potassium channel
MSFFLSTVQEYNKYTNIFNIIETIVMLVFTFELIIRFIAIGEDEKFSGFYGRLKYLKQPFVIIDIIVLLPYYFTLAGFDLIFLRVLRVFRILKLLRYEQYNSFDMTLLHILKDNKEKFIVILQLSSVLMLISAPMMYYLEYDAQPEVFSSIPAALWWSVITFATVGYGDMYPITALGKIVASLVSVLGIAFYAIPGAIFTSALLDELKKKRR